MDRTRRAEGRFGVVFVAILGTLIITAAFGDSDVGRVLVIVATAGTLLLSLQASGASRRVLSVAAAVVVVATVLSAWGSFAGPHSFPKALGATLFTLLIVASPVAIVRRLAQDRRISFQTVLGALCVYLLIGMLFASVFSLIGTVNTTPFFVQTSEPSTIDYLYFSYVTLATVGYGDYTAAGNVGRMLAVTEALIGQLYLVSVVALVVGNLGQTRTPGPLRRGRRALAENEETGADHPGDSP